MRDNAPASGLVNRLAGSRLRLCSCKMRVVIQSMSAELLAVSKPVALPLLYRPPLSSLLISAFFFPTHISYRSADSQTFAKRHCGKFGERTQEGTQLNQQARLCTVRIIGHSKEMRLTLTARNSTNPDSFPTIQLLLLGMLWISSSLTSPS